MYDSDRALKRIVGDKGNLVVEPMARNTAPAVALLCKILEQKNLQNEVVGVFPADHHVSRVEDFQKTVRFAAKCAEAGAVVTLGLQPTYPATGYGYIETSGAAAELEGSLEAFKVKAFREKPTETVAKEFISRGGFFWNAGIFIFRVGDMIGHFRKLMPELWTAIDALKPDLSNLDGIYARLESQSMDYGVMEKLDHQLCVPSDIGWSDLGSWDDIARMGEAGSIGLSDNRVFMSAVNAKNVFAYSSKKKVIGVVGVDDIAVIDTPDSLLIVKRGASQDVKNLVTALEKEGRVEAKSHLFELRPWGQFEVLIDDERYKTKRIALDAKTSISYQSHAKRAEHWIIVEGTGEVVLDGKIIPIQAGSHIHIPQGAKHRIRNTGETVLEFVEVQTGVYFGEDDIVRYSDDYGRS